MDKLLTKKSYWLLYGITALLFIVMLALMWNRFFYATPSPDEMLYFVEPYLIASGIRMFSEIWTITQGASFFLAPIINMFVIISGGTEGIALFARQAYFISKILFALFCLLALKKKTGLLCAALAVMPTVFLVPYSFFGMGYNTTSLDLALLSNVLIFSSNSYNKRCMILSISGIVSAITVIFYPPLIVWAFFNVIFVYVIYSRFSGKKTAIRASANYFASGIITAIVFSIIFITMAGGVRSFSMGIENLFSAIYAHPPVVRYNILSLFYELIFRHIVKHYVFVAIFFVITLIVVLLVIIFRRHISSYKNGFLLLCTCGFIIGSAAFFFIIPLRPGSYYYIFYIFIAFAATVSTFFLADRPEKIIHLCGMIIPGWIVIAVRIAASASSNVFVVVSPGPFIICIVLFFYKQLFNDKLRNQAHILPVPIMSVIMSAVCLFSTYQFINQGRPTLYPITYYSAKIESGIFKGLYCLPDRARDLLTLQNDIAKHSRVGKGVLVLDLFPAAYLMADMIPRTPNVWSVLTYQGGTHSVNDDYLRSYFLMTGRPPDTIFVIQHELSTWCIDDERRSFNQYIAQNYNQVYINATDTFKIIVFERK